MMDSPQRPLLLIPNPSEMLDVHVQIPRANDNLFERLIRDPQAPNRPMRERQCAEMLRGVLVACPSLALFVLKWLAQLAGVPNGLIDDLEWSFETEQPIGAKRDDLRIEGWRSNEDDLQLAVLWTVEIKVAAPLHESGLQEWSAEQEDSLPDDPETVIQLLNYDKWLVCQASEYRAGFVLALRDSTTAMPDGLTQPWYCITWTELAQEVEKVLGADLLPISERPFAKHMLGFIRHRLWDETDMTTARLELDDIALMRALAAIGPSCARKLKKLVNQFTELFKETDTEFLDVNSTSSFFDRTDKPQYSIGAKCTSDISWVTVSAGVVADDVRVWITCNQNAKDTKQAVRKLVREHQIELSDRNPDWVISDSDAPGSTDAKITKPLVSVLAKEDWQSPLIDFVRDAIGDLKAVGILDALVGMETKNHES